MKTIKFTATAEFTQEQITDFAKANRWNENHELSASDYAKEVIKQKLVLIVGAPTRDKMKKASQAKLNEELLIYEQGLNEAITVTKK